ncbi:hypothetical protein BDZ89DRAFT_1147773 [Hymenopellis radicata]|nr:hypothetical protein BDZ89DRAFT_1147773 [Hymenopellis radicata]
MTSTAPSVPVGRRDDPGGSDTLKTLTCGQSLCVLYVTRPGAMHPSTGSVQMDMFAPVVTVAAQSSASTTNPRRIHHCYLGTKKPTTPILIDFAVQKPGCGICISLSSTVSSASIMIRKLGSMGKLVRRNSLAG